MKHVLLNDVCSINMGQSPDSKSYNNNKDGLPFFQGNADFGERYPTRVWCNEPTKIAHAGDILISVRAPIGALNYAKEDCCIGRGLAALTPDSSRLLPDFLFWLLYGKRDELNSKGTGTTFKAINRKIIEETLVPDITLKQQAELSRHMERIYIIINLRKQQLAKLDVLIKARFIEMFGNPLSDACKWQSSTIGEQFSVASGGTPATGEKTFWDNGTIPWIGSNMCQDSILYENDGKFITNEGYAHSSAKIFHKGTVLVALVGATIGKTALLRFDTATNQNIAAIDVNRNEAFLPEFVFYHMQLLYTKFLEIGDGNFKMANQGFIRQLPLICPPINLQKQFATFVPQVEKSKAAVQSSLDKAQLLFDSLMQKYFG